MKKKVIPKQSKLSLLMQQKLLFLPRVFRSLGYQRQDRSHSVASTGKSLKKTAGGMVSIRKKRTFQMSICK